MLSRPVSRDGGVIGPEVTFIYFYLFRHTTTSTRQSVAILVEVKMDNRPTSLGMVVDKVVSRMLRWQMWILLKLGHWVSMNQLQL